MGARRNTHSPPQKLMTAEKSWFPRVARDTSNLLQTIAVIVTDRVFYSETAPTIYVHVSSPSASVRDGALFLFTVESSFGGLGVARFCRRSLYVHHVTRRSRCSSFFSQARKFGSGEGLVNMRGRFVRYPPFRHSNLRDRAARHRRNMQTGPASPISHAI